MASLCNGRVIVNDGLKYLTLGTTKQFNKFGSEAQRRERVIGCMLCSVRGVRCWFGLVVRGLG